MEVAIVGGHGQIGFGQGLDRGQIPWPDVASVLAAVLEARNTIGATFDLGGVTLR